MNPTTKNFSAILGMALCSLLAAGQFRTLVGTEQALASSSTALLVMALLSGLVVVTTSITTVGLVLNATKH
jgi:hypothetical protein